MRYEKYALPAAAANGAGPAVTVEVMENAARTAHRATVIPKEEFIRFRTHRHRFGTGIHVVWGIKSAKKKGPRGGRVYPHALLFDRKTHSPRKAKQWLKAHGYAVKKFETAVPKVKVPKKRPKRKVAAANVLPEGVMFQYVASMNPVNGPKTINKAIRIARQHAPSPYARAYADAAMQASLMYGIEGLRVQILYLLNNLRTWKGDLARETKKFMKAWLKAQDAARNSFAMNPAEPAIRKPPRVEVRAKHPGVTRLPRGAWSSWSEMQLANHFLGLVPTYGPGMVNNWIKNIERWNKVQNPKLSAKAYRVRMLVQKSPRYKKHLGRPRVAWRKPANPGEITKVCGLAMSNPTLMILSNPKKKDLTAAIEKEVRLAKKAYKSFHFREPKRKDTRKVPDGWPKVYVVLGAVDAFESKGKSGKVKKVYGSKKPVLACTKDRKDVFIFSRNGKLGFPAGVAVRVDYTVPAHSGRNKWSKSWYHPHDSNPRVTLDKSGKAARINGPGLSVSPRGIIG